MAPFSTGFLTVAFALATPSAMAAQTPHAKVEALETVESHKDGPAKTSLRFAFRVIPEQGLHINQEGPWQLDLQPSPGLSFAKTMLKKEAVDFTLPGFVVSTTALPTQPSGTLSYKLTAFVCTNDKTQCYRDVITGALDWKH